MIVTTTCTRRLKLYTNDRRESTEEIPLFFLHEREPDMMSNHNKATLLMNWIVDQALSGLPPMAPAEELARKAGEFPGTLRQKAEKLILRESVKNFSTGFVTGLGGPVTLPWAIPSSLTASWLLQTRLVAAIAKLGGHDLNDPRIRSLVLWALFGDAVKEVLKAAGVPVTKKITAQVFIKLPSHVFMAVQRKLGLLFLERTTRWGMNNLLKVVPVLGGAVAGTIDAVILKKVGKTAVELFIESEGACPDEGNADPS